ncbi:MAG: radical SAM protein [Candidatus Omnitrophota bacterium]|jgi:radical SAM superfamily enzyme YgiQ (UPF0313 family)
MKIVLIKPSMFGGAESGHVSGDTFEPLAPAVLAGLTPSGHEVVFYDDRIERIPYCEPAELVGITVETHTAKRAYDIASQYRRRGVKVVLGGFHPTLVPEEAIEHADSVAIGEAEELWPKIIEDTEKGRLHRFYKSEKPPSLSGLKPRKDIFMGKKYLPVSMVEFGRGCRNSCEFCAVAAFYRRGYRHRPVGEVIDELKISGKKTVFFTDDNIISDVEAAKELFRELISLKIRWIGQASINLTEDRELLELMKKSGCYCLVIGFESLNRENLAQMNKLNNIGAGDYSRIVNKIHGRGIKIYAAFILGYDHDDKDSFGKVLDFSLRSKFFISNFNHLMVYPSTPLYERLSREGRLLYRNWWLSSEYRYGKVAFRPKLMTAEELSENCMDMRARFSSLKSIAIRGTALKTNCGGFRDVIEYLVYNILSLKEVVRKDNMPLGAAPRSIKN